MYTMYARYYDQLNTSYDYWTTFIRQQTVAYPKGSRMIEFGCGTGNILSAFKDSYKLYGVDISREMIDRARQKIPDGEFYLNDMVTFRIGIPFDIAVCVFDTINHVLNRQDWQVFFSNVAQGLSDSGILILDANTTERLANISKRPPFFNEFDGNYFYMKLKQNSTTSFTFDVRVLAKQRSDLFREEKEEIHEITDSGMNIYSTLQSVFSKVSAYNDKLEAMQPEQFCENEASRWFFVCKK